MHQRSWQAVDALRPAQIQPAICFNRLRQQRGHQRLKVNWQRCYWNWIAASMSDEFG